MTSKKKSSAEEPPELPELTRRLHFSTLQALGIGMIVLLPVLAMFRVFGDGQASATARSGSVSLDVDYPDRIRYGSAESVMALVKNIGPALLDTVVVQFDSTYVARFSDPDFVPEPSAAFEVVLTDIAPGEVARVELAYHGEDYGRHRGWVSASHGPDTARLRIGTLVFP